MNGDVEMMDESSEKVAILDAGAQYGKVFLFYFFLSFYTFYKHFEMGSLWESIYISNAL